jgi:hypothetical protein
MHFWFPSPLLLFVLPLASHTSFILHLSAVNSPQQLINATPLHSIICTAIFLLSHPTQQDSNPSMHRMHNQHQPFPKKNKIRRSH